MVLHPYGAIEQPRSGLVRDELSLQVLTKLQNHRQRDECYCFKPQDLGVVYFTVLDKTNDVVLLTEIHL